MKDVYDDIRAAVAKAEARALKTRIRKLAAEQNRHDARKAEIRRETGEALDKARAALALIPKEPDAAPEPPTPEEDEPADMVQIPEALRRPYTPRASSK